MAPPLPRLAPVASNYLEIQRSNFVICHQLRDDPARPLAATRQITVTGLKIFRQFSAVRNQRNKTNYNLLALLLFVLFSWDRILQNEMQ